MLVVEFEKETTLRSVNDVVTNVCCGKSMQSEPPFGPFGLLLAWLYRMGGVPSVWEEVIIFKLTENENLDFMVENN